MADISLTLDIAGGGDEPYASGIVKVRRNIPGVGSGGYVDGSYHDIPLSNPPTVLGTNGFDPLEQGVYYDFLLPGMQVPISLQMPNTSTASFSDLAPIIPPIPIPNLVDGAIADLIEAPTSLTHAAIVEIAGEAGGGIVEADLPGFISGAGATRDAVDARAAVVLGSTPGAAAAAAAAVSAAMASAYLAYTLVYGTGDGTETWTSNSGTPVYSAGKFNNALSGARMVTDSGSVPIPASGQPVTIEMWVKTASAPTAIKVIGGLGASPYFAAEPTTGYASFNIDGTAKITSAVNICDNNWHHLAATVGRSGGSNTYTNFWVDGVPQGGSPTIGASSWTTAFTIGGLSSNAVYNWPGQIDELRVSTTARYTGTFTPSATAFVWDAACLLLAHLNDATYIAPAGGYPARPPSAPHGAVTYIGPVTPTTALTDDRWVNNA